MKQFYFFLVALLLWSDSSFAANAPDCKMYSNGIYLADPQDCQHFYLCENGQALRKDCGNGFFFDEATRVCNLAALVYCKGKEDNLDDEDCNKPTTPCPPPTTPCPPPTPKPTTPCPPQTPPKPTTPCPPPEPETQPPKPTTPCPPPNPETPCPPKPTTPCPPPQPEITTPCPTTTTPCPTTTTSCPTTTTPCPTTTTPCPTTTTPCPTTTTPCPESTTIQDISTQNLPDEDQQASPLLSRNDCRRLADGTLLYDTRHCRRFYVCLQGRPKKVKCHLGQWFDIEQLSCRNRREVTNCKANCN